MFDYTPLKITLFSKGMSMANLSLKLGKNKALIWRYVSGNACPSLETLDKITDILDCEIADVIRYEHTDSIDDKVKRYEEELRIRFVSPPAELEEFIKKMVEAYRKGLEE